MLAVQRRFFLYNARLAGERSIASAEGANSHKRSGSCTARQFDYRQLESDCLI